MVRRPGDGSAAPQGGAAAARLQMFERSRRATGAEGDLIPPEGETKGSAPSEKAQTKLVTEGERHEEQERSRN
jgi:hypothetical protein